MTIYPYTFASIDGASFPVGANNDGRLYQILANKMANGELKRYDFSNPVNTALNRQYSGTAFLAGGRYFELINEQVTLTANTTNYVTLNIDLSNASTPITISNESSNLSNTIDINGASGILRICFEIIITDSSSVTNVTNKVETDVFENIVSTGNATLNAITSKNVTNSETIKTKDLIATGNASLTSLSTTTAKVNSKDVYGSETNGGWYIEQIGANFYRLTIIQTVTNAVDYFWNSRLYISNGIDLPTLPSGYTKQSFTTLMMDTTNLMWCAPDSLNTFRLVTGSSVTSATRKVLVTVYATK